MFTLELLNSDLMMTGEESPFEDLENLRISPPRLSSPVGAAVAGSCSEIRRFFLSLGLKISSATQVFSFDLTEN